MNKEPGFIVKAPEHFLTPSDLQTMRSKNIDGRRDFLARAIPWFATKSLSTHEVYAVTAYLLNQEGIVEQGFVTVDMLYH